MTLQETRWHPDVTVATVVVRDGRFLQVEESIGGRLLLNQPAGHLEPEESLLQAAVRETLEETGWDVRLTQFIGTYQWVAPTGQCFLRFAFVADALAHHPERSLDTGVVRALWMTPEELQYDVRNVVKEVTLGTDLSTLLAEIDHWPTRG